MKNILLITALFFSSLIYAQIPVTDVAANTSLGMQLAKAVQQVATMKNQLTMLKKANDYVNKVNSKVTQLNHYKNLINEQSKALKMIKEIQNIGKGKADVNGLNEKLKIITGTIKTSQMILGKGAQMSDFERIQLLDAQYEKAQKVNMNLVIEKNRMSF